MYAAGQQRISFQGANFLTHLSPPPLPTTSYGICLTTPSWPKEEKNDNLLSPVLTRKVKYRQYDDMVERFILRLKFNLKALRQLRELTIFAGDALEHEDCAIQI